MTGAGSSVNLVVMYLKRLTISGFKSFATRSELELSPGITAIVGPNGSGKSNVADAIRWVLGEQSLKSLRGRRGEDLIFAGSGSRPRSSSAEVSLLIDNASGRGNLPQSEAEITRRIYRSGEGEYLLGGKMVRLLDVVTLLAESGFGQSTYTVVSQGMVDSLLIGTPGERKALFDEAVGVRPFYLKRDQTLKSLETTRANLDQIRSIIRELAPTLRALERGAKRAAERRGLEEGFSELARTYYGTRLADLEASIRSEKVAKREAERELSRVESEISKLERSLLSSDQSEDDLLAATRSELRELERSESRQSRELALIQGRIQAATEGGDLESRATLGELRRLEEEELELSVKLTALKPGLATHRQLEQKARAEQSRLKTELSELRSALRALETPTEPAALPLLREARSTLESISQAKENELPDLLNRLSELLRQAEEALAPGSDTELSALRERSGELESALSRAEESLQELSLQVATGATLSLELGERRGNLAERRAVLQAKMKDLGRSDTSETKVLETEAKRVEAELARLGKERESRVEFIRTRESTLSKQLAQLSDHQRSLSEKQRLVRELSASVTERALALARLETRRDDLRSEALRELGVSSLTDLGGRSGKLDLPAIEAELTSLRTRLAQIGEADPETTSEYEELRERHDFLTAQAKDLEAAATDLEQVLSELEDRIQETFRQSFTKIATAFSQRFTELFEGGKAEISLVPYGAEACAEAGDGAEPVSRGELGIQITASPPGKRLSELTALSGGERSLASAALLAAILTVNPSPFVVLDEVDAALDEVNTVKFGRVLQELSAQTQFILITHNRRTMELASTLYGVTMDENGISQLLSLKLEEAEATAEG